MFFFVSPPPPTQMIPHPRGLPKVLFIHDEDSFLRESQMTPEQAALEMRDAFQQLRLIRDQLQSRKDSLLDKIPEHERALQIIHHLQKQQNLNESTHLRFELLNNVYAKALVPPSGRVALWLGANVMLEFSYEEADLFLSRSISEARSSLDLAIADLEHIDDQQNTLEVNINRMHNYSVQRRKAGASIEAQLKNASIK